MLFLINALKQWLNSPKSSDFGELQGFALRINRAAVYSADIILYGYRLNSAILSLRTSPQTGVAIRTPHQVRDKKTDCHVASLLAMTKGVHYAC